LKNIYFIFFVIYLKKALFWDGLVLIGYLENTLAVSLKILKVFLFNQRLEPIYLKDKLLMERADTQIVISSSETSAYIPHTH
jgi:hypothetical protein